MPARHYREAAAATVMQAAEERDTLGTAGCESRHRYGPPDQYPERGAYLADSRHLLTRQVASDAAGSRGDVVGKSGSGTRSPSRRKAAPVSASATAPLHQTVLGDVPSSAPPTAGPRAT